MIMIQPNGTVLALVALLAAAMAPSPANAQSATGELPRLTAAQRNHPPPGGWPLMMQYGPKVGLKHERVAHQRTATDGTHWRRVHTADAPRPPHWM
jgi:hypothetical protein